MRASGKENEPLSPIKSLQTADAETPVPCPKTDTDSLCKDFSFMTLRDKNGCDVPGKEDSEPATPKQISKPRGASQETLSDPTTGLEFHTPSPTRPAPKTAIKRRPLQNASNLPIKPPASAPPVLLQPPLPSSPVQASLPQFFNASASPMQLPSPYLPYNSYQLPLLPMYPPYTPHPGHFDPSGRFSAGPGQLPNGSPSMYGFSEWDHQPYWVPTSPSSDSSPGLTPCTPASCYSPYPQVVSSSVWTYDPVGAPTRLALRLPQSAISSTGMV